MHKVYITIEVEIETPTDVPDEQEDIGLEFIEHLKRMPGVCSVVETDMSGD